MVVFNNLGLTHYLFKFIEKSISYINIIGQNLILSFDVNY